MAGKIQKAGGEEYHKKSSRKIKYDQADQKRAAQLEYYQTDDGHQHDAVHHHGHKFPLSDIKKKAGRKAAYRQQKPRPLPDVSACCMMHGDRVVQRTEDTCHQDDKQCKESAGGDLLSGSLPIILYGGGLEFFRFCVFLAAKPFCLQQQR